MKPLKNLLILTAVFLLNGCSDFLEPTSLSTFDTTLIFSNVDDARKATNNIYKQFSEDGYRTRLSITMQGITDIDAGGDKNSIKDNYTIMALKAASTNQDLTKAWNSAYAAIKDCNVVIDGILASKIYNSTNADVSADMHHFLGEAYTIRAFWYSQLAYNWGDVPYVRDAPRAGVDFDLPKTDRNEILTGVIQDLIDAEPTMKWADQLPQSVQQVNREFAIGMIARLSLQRAGYYLKPDMTKAVATASDRTKYYTIARDYSQKLMNLKDRQLPTDFAQIFKNQCQQKRPANSDMLFEIPFAITTGEVGYNIGMRVNNSTPASNPNFTAHEYGLGNRDYAMPLSYFYSFDVKDKRRAASCGLYNLDKFAIPSMVTALDVGQAKWSKEYCDPVLGSANSKGTGINWPVMRYSDVLLMFAEAENELNNGPTAAAKTALARVRERAFDSNDWAVNVTSYIANNSTSKAAFLNAIVNERAWEFGGELLRKQELIRWGIYEQKMQETVDKIKEIADNTSNKYASNIYWRIDNRKMTIHQNVYTGNSVPPGFTIVATDDGLVSGTTTLGGWNKTSWALALKTSTGYATFLDTQYSPYLTPTPVRYIQPIPSVAIDNSTVLKNDGYGF